MTWFNLHVHSQFSVRDGMTRVHDLAEKAWMLGQPAMGLSDHGNMAGTIQLYKACKKFDIAPFPGFEGYLLDPRSDDPYNDKTQRYHLGLYALDIKGYKALVRFVSMTYTRPHFSRFPRMLLSDLADLGRSHGKHLVLTTGCFFGLIQKTVTNGDSPEALRALKMFAQWFPHTIVELQHHNIVDDIHDDDVLVRELVYLAKTAGLPVMAGQDNHYTDQSQKKAHALMKRMVYGGEDDEFPGDYFHFGSAEWVSLHYDPRTWKRVSDTSDYLLSINEMTMPPLDEFKVHMPAMAQRPMKRLRAVCEKEFAAYTAGMSATKVKKRFSRLNEELSVIEDINMPNYFLIWRKFEHWLRAEKIAHEARGSANGSFVCFLLGISQVDPIIWGVNYERFISRDRIKPPDIDMDIEDIRRHEAVNWLLTHFPSVQIGTWGKLGTSINDDGEETGSVFVTYLAYLRGQCEKMARETVERKNGKKGEIKDIAFAIFNKRYGHVKSMRDVYHLSKRDYRALRTLSNMDSVYKSYGVHAGGVLLGSDTLDLDEYVPTMLVASSNKKVSQFNMDDVEELGLLKMDLLGQATLAVMRICQELIGRADPLDFTWIPLDDRKACAVLRSGQRDNGVFHFEAYTKSKGGKEMAVRSTMDAVIATAAYMPGCVDSGQKDKYVETRRDPNKRRRYMQDAEDLHPIVAHELAETNGIMIFQEQPLQILRKLGMSVANVNLMYKTLKDSGRGAVERNRIRLDQLRIEFDKLCTAKGVSDPDAVWQAVTGFMAYGFNKAHSAGYGLRSYRCAYLKVYHPLEFMTALLAVWSGRKKETLYVREARRIGLRIGPPDINISGVSWSLDRRRGAIRRGLLSIKGIGDGAAREIAEKAPYKSIEDLVHRVSGRAISGGVKYLKTGIMTGKLKALDDAGALESLKE